MVNFGEKIRTLRTEQNLTQKQLADRIGLATSAISSYESGNRYPSYDVLIKFSRIFHVSTDYLLGIEKRNTLDVSSLDENSINVLNQLINLMKKN